MTTEPDALTIWRTERGAGGDRLSLPSGLAETANYRCCVAARGQQEDPWNDDSWATSGVPDDSAITDDEPDQGTHSLKGSLARLWLPNERTLAWFCICFAVGIVVLTDFVLTGNYGVAFVFMLLWTAIAGAFAVSEWRALR